MPEQETLPVGEAKTIDYTYDADSRLLTRQVKDGEGEMIQHTRWLWSGWLPLIEEQLDAEGTVTRTRTYLWGEDRGGGIATAAGIGGLLGVIQKTGDTTHTYTPVDDGLGNIRAYLDETGKPLPTLTTAPLEKDSPSPATPPMYPTSAGRVDTAIR